MNRKWKLVLTSAIIVGVNYLLFRQGLLDLRDIDELAIKIRELGLFSIVILMLLIVLQQIVTFVPFLSLATLNVMIFGFWGGFALSWLSSLIGAVLAFWLARNMLSNWIKNKWGTNPTFIKINRSLKKSGFFYVLMGRLFPIMPSNLINFGAGISGISITTYSIATIVGNIPFVFTSSVMAYDLYHLEKDANQERFTYVSIGLAAFVIINLLVKYVAGKRKVKQNENDTSNI